MPKAYRKSSGSWTTIQKIYRKSGGSWSSIQSVWRKVNGAWIKVFAGATNSDIATRVTISKSTDSTTKLVTLTGTNYHWNPIPDTLTYQFQWYDGIDWVSIASGSITNPSSGSSNTKTTVVDNSIGGEINPDTENRYRFVVFSVYNNNNNNSTSLETTIQTPRDILDLSAIKDSSAPNSNINLLWTSPAYAVNCKVYRKLGSGSYSQIAVVPVGVPKSSYSDSGLIGSSTYTYKVVGITGNENYVGYTGNESSEVSETTSADPSFSITSSTKGVPGTPGPYGSTRGIYMSWEPVAGATSYQYKIETSDDGLTWTDASTGSGFVAVTYPSFSTTNTSTTQDVWAYKPYYRVYVRAVKSSGGFINASNVPYLSDGTAPSGLSVSESSKTATSFTFTWSLTSAGSNTLNNIQYKIGAGGTWTNGGTTSPITISGLSASTSYTVYIRAENKDILYSSEQYLSFTTPTASIAPSGGSASISGTGTQGQTLTLSKTDATGSPSPTVSWVWQRNDGGVGGSAYQNVQTGGTTYSLGTWDAGYSIRAIVTWTNGVSPDQSVTTNAIGPITPLYWYVYYNANGGTNAPSSTAIVQGKSGNVTSSAPTRSGYSFSGWNTASDGSGTNYSANALITPSSDVTLYAKWTVVFTTPTCAAPSLYFDRVTSSSVLRWYSDYPVPSGSVESITGMQFEIRTTAGGGTLLASGTRAYSSSYIYYGGGTYWQFKMGTELNDISYSSSARYGRARVVMLGTNGTTYYGTWSGWL